MRWVQEFELRCNKLVHILTDDTFCIFLDNTRDSLPFERDLDSLTPQFDSFSLSDIELPPVEIDSLGLGLL